MHIIGSYVIMYKVYMYIVQHGVLVVCVYVWLHVITMTICRDSIQLFIQGHPGIFIANNIQS